MTDPYSPSPELVEALRERGFYRADVYDTTRAAVAYRTEEKIERATARGGSKRELARLGVEV